MRFVILIACLALAFTASVPAEAQTQTGNPPAQAGKLWQAPVGHRQPTIQSVEKARSEKGDASKSQQRGSDLDKNLIICRGC
jgi:hypothetical protein